MANTDWQTITITIPAGKTKVYTLQKVYKTSILLFQSTHFRQVYIVGTHTEEHNSCVGLGVDNIQIGDGSCN